MRQLIDSGRYDTHENFTVVLQPFMRDIYLPRLEVRADTSETFLLVPWNVNIHPHCFPFERMVVLIAHTLPLTVSIWARKLIPSWLELFGTTWWASCISPLLYVFLFLLLTSESLTFLVRTSGQQNIYTGFRSWYWFEMSLQGMVSSFKINNAYFPDVFVVYEFYFVSCWLSLDQPIF